MEAKGTNSNIIFRSEIKFKGKTVRFTCKENESIKANRQQARYNAV